MRPCGYFFAYAAALLTLVLVAGSPAESFAQSEPANAADFLNGPIRLRQPQQISPAPATSSAATQSQQTRDELRVEAADRAPRYRPGEFELYIQGASGDENIRRFGSEFVIDAASLRSAVQETSVPVPADYKVAPGDELLISIWGSVDADLRLTVDRTGRVNIPRVGNVVVSGLTVPDVSAAVGRQAGRVFKNFELSVSLGQLRNIRIFVTGFAVRPGAYTVSSLSTLSTVIFGRSGGPSASGSFRDIELRRAGRNVAKLDLYDLMLFGKRDADQPIQSDDVIHIGPIGRQVALIGSVNKAAIFEIRDNETLTDLLRMGGGFNSVADRSRVAVERVSDRNDRRVRQLALPANAAAPLDAGDLVRTFSAIDAALPLQRQNKRVRIEGEVQRPGTFILPPDSSVADALNMAGGLTAAAFLFGTEFNRESVRLSQQINYERALRDFEVELSRRTATTQARTSDDVAVQNQQQVASERMLSRLRITRPSGRVVLQIPPAGAELPNLALEDGDRLFVPARPSTVGVFGSVFNAGSYLFDGSKRVDDYLRLAGSPTKGADKSSIFVVRANGSVVSAQQGDGGWFGVGGTRISELAALPGDTIFVPEDSNKTSFLQSAKDWTQVLYQLGLGIASIKLIVP